MELKQKKIYETQTDDDVKLNKACENLGRHEHR